MSATIFCESSSFMVKNAVKVLCVFDNKHVRFLCSCCHKNKTKDEGSGYFLQVYMIWRLQRNRKFVQMWSYLVIITCIKMTNIMYATTARGTITMHPTY